MHRRSTREIISAPYPVLQFTEAEKAKHPETADCVWCCSCSYVIEYDDIVLCSECEKVWAHQRCMGVTKEDADDPEFYHRCYVCLNQSTQSIEPSEADEGADCDDIDAEPEIPTNNRVEDDRYNCFDFMFLISD